VVLVSDVCFELAAPLLERLGGPTIFCHHLQSDEAGLPVAFLRRKPPGKGSVVRAFQKLGYYVMALGDSFNDIEMLSQANRALLLDPPPTLVARCPHLAVVDSLETAASRLGIGSNPARDDGGAVPRRECHES
jgi:phosphoserine/homoserine phosphotransferase